MRKNMQSIVSSEHDQEDSIDEYLNKAKNRESLASQDLISEREDSIKLKLIARKNKKSIISSQMSDNHSFN